MSSSGTNQSRILQVTQKDPLCFFCLMEFSQSLIVSIIVASAIRLLVGLAFFMPFLAWFALIDLSWLIVILLTPIIFLYRCRDHFKKKREKCSDDFLRLVEQARDTIPESVQRFISSKGYRVIVVKRMSDVAPRMVAMKSEFPEDSTFERVQGMCYKYFGKILIAEIIPVENVWFPAHSTVTKVLAHEVGHAIDFCLHDYSHTRQMKVAHQNDYAKLSELDKQRYAYYVRDGAERGRAETFAEIYSCLIGQQSDGFEKLFPETTKIIDDELKARGLI